MQAHDPLDQDQEWWYPSTYKQQIIPRNIKMAMDIIGNRELTNTECGYNSEYVFYNMIEDELLVVEPIEVLKLVNVTTHDLGEGRYKPTTLTVEDWIQLKPILIYIGNI